MKRLIKQVSLLLALALSINCGKSVSPEAPEQSVVPEPVVVLPTPAVSAKLLPVKLEAAGQTIQLNYQGNSARLSSVIDSKGMKITLLYKDEVLTGYLMEGKTEVFMNDIWRDEHKRIHRVSKYQEATNIIPGGEYQIDYDDKERFSAVRYYSARNKLLKTTVLTYDGAENVVQLETDEGGNQTQQRLSYDVKNGIFKNVPGVRLLFLDTDLDLFTCNAHNVMSRSGVSYLYNYRPDDFPEMLTIIKDNVKTVFKVSYKTF